MANVSIAISALTDRAPGLCCASLISMAFFNGLFNGEKDVCRDFGRPGCPYCVRAKRIAEQQLTEERDDFEFRFVDINVAGLTKDDLAAKAPANRSPLCRRSSWMSSTSAAAQILRPMPEPIWVCKPRHHEKGASCAVNAASGHRREAAHHLSLMFNPLHEHGDGAGIDLTILFGLIDHQLLLGFGVQGQGQNLIIAPP